MNERMDKQMDIRRKAATSCPDGRSIQPTHEITQMSHESEGGRDHLDRKSTVTPAHSVGCSVGRKGEQLLTLSGWHKSWDSLPMSRILVHAYYKSGSHLSWEWDLQWQVSLPAFADGPWLFQASCSAHEPWEGPAGGIWPHCRLLHLAEALQSKLKF